MNIKYDNFLKLDEVAKQKIALEAIEKDSRNRRLLSPSESINSVTVGAIYADYNTEKLSSRKLSCFCTYFLFLSGTFLKILSEISSK